MKCSEQAGGRRSKKVRRAALAAGFLAAGLLGGCGYFPVDPDPIRIVDSPADVMACRRLGPVSGPTPTNGQGPVTFASRTVAVLARPGVVGIPAPEAPPPGEGGFQYRLQDMRDAALSLGATDLLLRRVYRDWSYVEGVAYFCRH